MRFRLTPRWMTLDDQLTCYKFEFSRNFAEFADLQTWEPTAKRMKIDRHCQRQNCSLLNVLFSGILR